MLPDICSKFKNVKEIEVGKYSKVKVGPMKFKIRAYDIEGIGRLSIMEGTALFGLMKMDTVMLSSINKDAPLFSYDRILAMGNDTLIFEVYNTCKEDREYSNLTLVKERYISLPEHDLGSHWYDSIKCKESVSKKGKKITPQMDELVKEYIDAFIEVINNAPTIDENEKKALNDNYVQGLLNNGGPSTDQFVKAIGKEETTKLFTEILFGTK